jgi:anion-transporting  ArsA/GET3 family ATPase
VLYSYARVAFLLDKQLVFVTGKGGVGKTTVAGALGMAAARRGRHTIVCEVAQQHRLADTFGVAAAAGQEAQLDDDLFSLSVDQDAAMREYLEDQVGSRLYRLMFESRIFQYLAAATPGLRELLTIGKAWDLAQPDPRTHHKAYDLVIVDAPATGHGISMLRTPRTFRDVARVGPISRHAARIDEFLTDPEITGVVAVATPEEMPVNETIEFVTRLDEEMQIAPDVVVVNGLYPHRFTADEVKKIEAADGEHPALRAALSEHRRVRSQRAQLRRLRAHAPCVTLPFLFQSDLDRGALEFLAEELEEKF